MKLNRIFDFLSCVFSFVTVAILLRGGPEWIASTLMGSVALMALWRLCS
jgi:hypothetical protein